MRRQPAKVLEPDDVRRVLGHVRHQRYPKRNRVMILLSFKAGLRACEIAGLDWAMVLGSDHRVSDLISIACGIAKNGASRRVPISPELRTALTQLHSAQGRPLTGPVIHSERGCHMTPGSVSNWFSATYAELGLVGCSSHSGRRTFITRAARVLAKSGGSLRDIQELAGHRSISTTEGYIEGDRQAQRRLVGLI